MKYNSEKNPGQQEYLKVLRGMSPEERLKKAFELSTLGKDLFKEGLKKRFPDLSQQEINRLYLERVDKCHNRNY